jgi:peptidoglycan/LPS O-acetylase OafA/YrhL/4-amino-4-deoxy-L-arabinose transferase-like glycosyltransferase
MATEVSPRPTVTEADTAPAPAGAATPSRRRFAFGVAIIAGLGLVWRTIYILTYKRGDDACGQPLCGDAIYYSAQARAIADGRFFQDPFHAGVPAADHPPLAALVLTPVAMVTHSVLAQRFLMALFGTAAIVVIGYLGRRVGGDRVGWIAAGIAAVNANLWMNDALVMSESVATLGIAVTLLLVYRFRDEPSWGRAAWLGVACGVTILARAEMALLVPLVVLPVALLSRRLSIGQRIGRFAVVAGLVVVVLAPWTLFNASRFAKPVLISTNDGITLVGANCPSTYYEGGIGFWNLDCRNQATANLDPNLDQSQVSAELRGQAFDFIRANKSQVPKVVETRLRRLWNAYYPHQMVYLNTGEGREAWASWTGVVMADVLFALSAFGTFWLWKRRVPVWPLLATAVIASITAVIFYGIVRFRLPADIAMCVLGAVAVEELARRTLRWWRDRPERVAERQAARARRRGEVDVNNTPEGKTEISGGAHFPCLDAFRAIAMTLVLVNHAAYSTGYISRSQLPGATAGERIIGPILARTDLGVTAFFVLSGFLLFRPFALKILAGGELGGLRTFYRRRVLRIFPAYWVALFGIAIVFGLHIAGIKSWIANIFLLPAVGAQAQVCDGDVCHVAYGITQAWSIGIEATFYLVLPFLAMAMHRLGRRRDPGGRIGTMLVFVAGVYLVSVGFRLVVVFANPSWARESLIWLPMYLDIFAVGMALAVVSAAVTSGHPMPKVIDRMAAHPWWCWLAVGGIYAFMTLLPLADQPFGLDGNEYLARQLLYGIGSAIWLWPAIFGDQSKGRLRAFLASRPMVYLGAISLSFYLWHLNILEQVKDWTVPNYSQLQDLAAHPPAGNTLAGVATFTGNVLAVAVLTWLISFVVASVLFRAVELPFLRLRDRPLRDLLVRPPAASPIPDAAPTAA